MKKTYWWRIIILLFSTALFGYGYLAANNTRLGLCKMESGKQACFIHYNSYIDPLMFFSIFLFAISLLLFFVSDKIFLKCLRFAGIWMALSIILIALTPKTSGGWISLGPDREMVSIWMGALFFILSLGRIVWDVRKEKKHLK
jgi:hypothetical protein